jgi:hypothetical protein
VRFLQLFKSEHKVILHKTQSLILLLARLELGLVLVDFFAHRCQLDLGLQLFGLELGILGLQGLKIALH